MKKISLSAAIIVSDSVSTSDVLEALKGLSQDGNVAFDRLETIDLVEQIPDEYMEVSVAMTGDDEDSLCMLDEDGDPDPGVLVKDIIDVDELKDVAICTEVSGSYPDSEKYGFPDYAMDGQGHLVVGEAGFKMHKKGLCNEEFECSNDDGTSVTIFKLKVPKGSFESYFVSIIEERLVDARVTEAQMVEDMEAAGFFVDEIGSELLTAYATSVYQGDVYSEYWNA